MTIKNRQFRETGNTWHTRRRKNKAKTQRNMCCIPLSPNKTLTISQATGSKDNRTLFPRGNSNGHHNTERHIIGQHKKLKRGTTRQPLKKNPEVKSNGKQFLLLIRHLACNSYMQSIHVHHYTQKTQIT